MINAALLVCFFVTALVYSIAGLGGGSTYLALLALFAVPYPVMPRVALLCNLVVVSGGCWHFFRAGHFSFRRVAPFVLTSIPMATWGGCIPIGTTLFTLLLGISLLIAALRMFLSDRSFESKTVISGRELWMIGLPVGALLGFLSGLVGIGGGIYLAPLLLFLGWADAKQTAAASSFFILVNSLAGLAGQMTKGPFLSVAGLVHGQPLLLLLLAVWLGGQIGSRIGAHKLPKLELQRVTATLILLVAVRLLWRLV